MHEDTSQSHQSYISLDFKTIKQYIQLQQLQQQALVSKEHPEKLRIQASLELFAQFHEDLRLELEAMLSKLENFDLLIINQMHQKILTFQLNLRNAVVLFPAESSSWEYSHLSYRDLAQEFLDIWEK